MPDPDPGVALAVEAAKEVVKALVEGLVETVKKVPGLWRRSGERKRKLLATEIARSISELQAAEGNLPAVRARQEGIWEARLLDLLAEDPAAAAEVRDIVSEIRRHQPEITVAAQNITASAANANAQGVIFGNIYNHTDASGTDGPDRVEDGPQ